MFFKLLVVCIAFAAVYAEHGFDVSRIPEDVRALIPKEVKDFYKGLTDDDRKVIKEIRKMYWSFPHDEKSLEVLKEKSPSLHEKVIGFRQMVASKIESLNEEAKAFAKEAIESLKQLYPKEVGEPFDKKKLGETLKAIHEKKDALSEEAQKSLEEQFPQTTKFFKNEKVCNFLKAYFKGAH
ncbi:unnamed protein product [Enterobius vermicularis]|uniref:Fatty-acid and retinol-binding protein 1 n=1 Tax=Enterobius vermicularis TaxID=51028 RepID=A0A0N4VG15_ENTVE|nr:unnamed protein product [Enterobius vermicularis]